MNKNKKVTSSQGLLHCELDKAFTMRPYKLFSFLVLLSYEDPTFFLEAEVINYYFGSRENCDQKTKHDNTLIYNFLAFGVMKR
jgi:hypothetical protein